ncbi:MAG: 30S ribosomal protein S6 [Rhizobiaceae bacterium]|nr:30S ribosomal protein S6 [Rhizobiaceae bacterium]
MALYEHIFLARQDLSGAQVDELIQNYKSLLEENGGSVGRIENWGLKSLTYRIKKNRKAHYALLNIEAPGAAIHEMERQMRINEDILRYMTVSVEEHEEGPSVMMQKRDRDDRGRGGDRGDRGGRGERGESGRRPREAAAQE